MKPRVLKPIPERLLSRVEKTPTCWVWTGAKYKTGYGAFSLYRKNILAHRASYSAFIGPIPEGLWVLHRCDNPACINPEHLFLGTAKDNTDDMVKKGRDNWVGSKTKSFTCCRRGHPFTDANIMSNGPGKRHCRTCYEARDCIRRPHLYGAPPKIVVT